MVDSLENNEKASYSTLVAEIERWNMLINQRMIYDDLTDYKSELFERRDMSQKKQ